MRVAVDLCPGTGSILPQCMTAITADRSAMAKARAGYDEVLGRTV